MEPPQLRMRHPLRHLPPERPLPEGMTLRAAIPRDADPIAQVLTAAFEDPWSPERVLRELLEHPEVPVTFVVQQGDRVVATASYQVQAEPDPDAGWLHWVGVHPSARGHGLGEIVCRRVLQEAVQRNRCAVLLTTDDPRLPAIRTYFKLGFEADPWHSSHATRWETVRRLLAAD